MQTVRRRVVTRAQFLQRDPTFLQAMRNSVAAWNSDYPEFQTRQVNPFPNHDPSDNAPRIKPFADERLFQPPPDLALAIDRDFPDLRAEEALRAWQARMESLADFWWNPKYFPRWMGTIAHPAAAFVRACHMCEPGALDADAWIPQAPLTPFFLSYDPTDAETLESRQARWIDRYFGFYGRLIEAVRSGTPVTEDLLAALDRDASHESEKKARERPSLEFPYMPIFPGVERRDYRAAESRVLSLADDHLHEYARDLQQQGYSFRRIAAELGVHRKTVGVWLRSPLQHQP
jgi:Putative ATPase subunit of terminase (gpP-like)